MTDALDHLGIMNNALARIGAGGITSEDEDSDLAEQVTAIYYDRIDALLGMHAWSFAGKTYKLDAVSKAVENGYDAAAQKFSNGWRHAFRLPGTRIGAPRRNLANPRDPHSPLRDFLIEAGILYADVDQVWSVVTVRTEPEMWDPLFRLAATMLSAADLCVPVTHDAGLAKALREDGEGTAAENGRGGMIGRALATDAAKSRTVAPIWSDPLSDARLR